MTDPRNNLFSEIHRTWLKPLGFRKLARKSVKVQGDDESLAVTLESYPAVHGGPYYFSLEARANWGGSSQSRITYCMYLPSYVTKQQFWTFNGSSDFAEVERLVKRQFECVALPALEKMQSLEGVLELFQDIPPHVGLHWYYESYFNLLNRLGRKQEGRMLLREVIETAPHKGIADAAKQLLIQQEATIQR